MRVMWWVIRVSISMWRMGRLANGIIGLGILRVRGWRRDPLPPTRINALVGCGCCGIYDVYLKVV